MDDLRGKRVLVTGAAGFIGANLTRELVRREAEVHALVRPSTELWRIAEIVPHLTLHRVDLLQFGELQRMVAGVNPEIVFHLAAQGVAPAHVNSWENVPTNVLGTAHLLQATASAGYERFVHMGGSLEYGPRQRPLRESDALQPITLRGATKAAATLLCQQFARTNGRPIVVLRPFSVYGCWEEPTRLVPTAIRAALRNQELALTAPGYRRDWVFVEDVVEACLLALRAPQVAGEIINVGSGEQWSNEEVVAMVEAVTGQRIEVYVGAYPARPTDTTYWVADIRKAKRLLGWQPRHTLRSGLEKTISWFRCHGEAWEDAHGRPRP